MGGLHLHRGEHGALSNLRPRQFDPFGSARVLDTAHASDQIERVPIQPAVPNVHILHVNGDNLADHKAAARGDGREIENLMQSAFETDGDSATRAGRTSLEGAGVTFANSNSLTEESYSPLVTFICCSSS